MLVILLTKTIVPGWAWWHTLSSTQEAEAGRIAVSFRPDPESKTDRQRERDHCSPYGFFCNFIVFQVKITIIKWIFAPVSYLLLIILWQFS